MSLTSMYVRYSFGKGDRKRDAGLSTPEDVKRYDDILYGKRAGLHWGKSSHCLN